MASLPCGQWVNDPNLPMLLDRGLVYQWQSVRGQEPQWVPIPMPDPSSAAQAPRLNEMLRVAPQPRGSVAAACTTSTAMPLSQPMPKRMPKSPSPPPSPTPRQQEQPQPVPERPGQPAVFKDLAEALGHWQQQQTALGQQQVTLQKQTLSLQHLAMKQIQEEQEQKRQKLHHMAQQQVAMKEQYPMATQLEKAVSLQQANVEEQVLPTVPLPGRLAALWSEGHDAGSGSAAASSGSGLADPGTGAAAGGMGGAASDRATGSSGKGPTAAPQKCPWQWTERFNKMKFEMVETLGFVKQCIHNVAILEGHKAHC